MNHSYRVHLSASVAASNAVEAQKKVRSALSRHKTIEIDGLTAEQQGVIIGVGAKFEEGIDGQVYMLSLIRREGIAGPPLFALIGLDHGESWDHEAVRLGERVAKMKGDAVADWILISPGNVNYLGSTTWEGTVKS